MMFINHKMLGVYGFCRAFVEDGFTQEQGLMNTFGTQFTRPYEINSKPNETVDYSSYKDLKLLRQLIKT